jgi:hypothetical protein
VRSACNLASHVLGTLPVVAVTSQSSISTDVFQEIGIEVVLSVSRRGGVCDRIAREFVGNSFLAALSVHSSDELSGARRRKNPKVEAANSAISRCHSKQTIDNAGRGMSDWPVRNNDPTAIGLDEGGAGTLLIQVVWSLNEDVGSQLVDYRERRVILKNNDLVNRPKGQQHLSPFSGWNNGTCWAFQTADTFVGVNCNE